MAVKFSNSLHYYRPLLRSFFTILPTLLGISFSTLSWAARTAVVTSDKAVIWADTQRSAPLGYARRGKVLRVGDKDLSKGQVVSVILSGKVAYISIEDISIEDQMKKKDFESQEGSRFKEVIRTRYNQYIVASGVMFSAAESKNSSAERPGDTWSFIGGQLKGVVQKEDAHVGVAFLFEYLYADNKIANQDESFRMFTFGGGPSIPLINGRRLQFKLEGMFLMTPWAQYEAQPLFTLNGYGAGALGQASMLFYPWENVGFEITAGAKALKVFGIRRPSPFKEFDPMFIGTHFSTGLSYRF